MSKYICLKDLNMPSLLIDETYKFYEGNEYDFEHLLSVKNDVGKTFDRNLMKTHFIKKRRIFK